MKRVLLLAAGALGTAGTWKLSCVVDNGTIFPPEAMPGQCGGGW